MSGKASREMLAAHRGQWRARHPGRDRHRFARDILVQETGWRFLKERGIDLIAADSPGAFLDDTPTSKMVRQLLGVISEFEKASLVAQARGSAPAQAGDRREGRWPQEPCRGSPRRRGAGQARWRVRSPRAAS